MKRPIALCSVCVLGSQQNASLERRLERLEQHLAVLARNGGGL